MSTRAYNVREDRLKIGCWEDAFNKRTNMVIVQLTRITRKEGQWGVITCNQRLLVPYSLVTLWSPTFNRNGQVTNIPHTILFDQWPCPSKEIFNMYVLYKLPLSHRPRPYPLPPNKRCTRCTKPAHPGRSLPSYFQRVYLWALNTRMVHSYTPSSTVTTSYRTLLGRC